tara:strand:- start:33 stop:266 length:234 start_codon:yes stop_codon:yes gene_type:complete
MEKCSKIQISGEIKVDYVDYQVRTYLTQSAPCDDWDKLNESMLNLYDKGRLNVSWDENNEPHFYAKDKLPFNDSDAD